MDSAGIGDAADDPLATYPLSTMRDLIDIFK
jgi:hypothetical protein